MMKKINFQCNRLIAALLALICVLGLFPATALAADAPATIKLDDCEYSSTQYDSPSLGTCHLQQMHFDYNGTPTMAFCAQRARAWENL